MPPPLAALALSLAGDRGRAATVPAAVYGQDPLEVLELKVRPNVIVVLDSSGSMSQQRPENRQHQLRDHPRSKLYQAKQVLKTVVQNNQDKVSFQFGTYTQSSITLRQPGGEHHRQPLPVRHQHDAGDGPDRPRGPGRHPGRGLQSWQIIQPDWSRLYFGEQAGVIC